MIFHTKVVHHGPQRQMKQPRLRLQDPLPKLNESFENLGAADLEFVPFDHLL